MINIEKIGARIAELRKQHHLSQERFAEDLGWYQPDVSKLESGKGGSGINDLYKLSLIADYFQIPLQYLIFGEGDGKMMEQKEQEKPKAEKPNVEVDISVEALAKLSEEIEMARHTIKGDLYRANLLREEMEHEVHLLLQGDSSPLELEVLSDKLDYYKKAGAFLDKDVKQIRAKLYDMYDRFTDEVPDNFLRIYNRFEYDVMAHVTELDDMKVLMRNYESFLQELIEKQGA